ncbi:MAG: metallophosphoesterase [Bacteroidetes bacterium]|nr:metallophosphoesterase [Bacteroidota bacterium]
MQSLIFTAMIIGTALMAGCREDSEKPADGSQPVYEVAFMPDIHFHDLFAEFEPGSFEGLPVMYKGEEHRAVIRTMEAQHTSTRLFNENYFALLAALDSAVDRGIKHIGLPGDFSDDGQPAHVNGLVDILDTYRTKHNVSFFITPGNHDPGRPFTSEAGKRDYLGRGGKQQPVFSHNHPFCREEQELSPSNDRSHAVACTDQVKELGYDGLFELIGDFGLNSNSTNHYYETPFSGNRMDDGELPETIFEPENRLYEICHEGSGGAFRQAHYTNCFDVMDMSYLVEPVEGLWLLALDTNVYIPRKNAAIGDPAAPANFSGSGNAGYNKVVTHKKHLVEWMADVAERAAEHGKTLISFSHFPAADFYNGAGTEIERVWGEDQFQLVRVPTGGTTNTVVNTGIGLHIAGHMHMNGVEIVRNSESGQVLTNIQVPSLAAYVPAYKIVRTFEEPGHVEVETVTLNEVPEFDTLFPLYEQEWNYLDSTGYEHNWNREILQSENYLEFTDWHIRELSRLRFLPGEWPADIRNVLTTMNGRDLLIHSVMPDSLRDDSGLISKKRDSESGNQFISAHEETIRKAREMTENAGYVLDDFARWDGTDLSVDFYRIRNAGELALRDISAERIDHYSIIASAFLDHPHNSSTVEDIPPGDKIYDRLASVFRVISLFSTRLPGDHIRINLQTGEITTMKKEMPRISVKER